MAFMDNFSQIMQNIAHFKEDADRMKICMPNIDDKVCLFLENKINSKQQENEAINYLRQQKNTLLSIGIEYTKPNTNSNSNSNSSESSIKPTPKRFSKKKPKYSSKKKQRPTLRRTPLRSKQTNKIPQKKTLLSLTKNNHKTAINQTLDFTEMNVDSDSESENEKCEINFVSNHSKTMVQQKLESKALEKAKKKQRFKGKVNALQRANQKRINDEKRERERQKKKEIQKLQILENKKKRKELLLKQQQMQMKNFKKKTMKCTANKRTKKKRKIVKNVRKPLQAINNSNNNRNFKEIKAETKSHDLSEGKVYAISDYDSDFSDSDLDEENCLKFIPIWARKSNPRQFVKRQCAIDPDIIFGRMFYKTCDLQNVFKDYPSRTKYRQRSQSGDWSKDQSSFLEENMYKKNMGWIERK